jgi:hypothetical protein
MHRSLERRSQNERLKKARRPMDKQEQRSVRRGFGTEQAQLAEAKSERNLDESAEKSMRD